MMTPLFNMASAMEKKEDVGSYQEMVTENQGESTVLDESGDSKSRRVSRS
ncbi:MAG: hypothetical protein ACLSWP_12100 [Terrisporobacter sp.]